MQITETHNIAQTKKSLADMLSEAAHTHTEAVNRRGKERYPYSAPVRLGLVDSSGQFRSIADACSTDVSQGGLGLLSKIPLPLGNLYVLEFHGGTPKAWRIQARVAYCRPLFADVFRIGATFLVP